MPPLSLVLRIFAGSGNGYLHVLRMPGRRVTDGRTRRRMSREAVDFKTTANTAD